MRKNALADTKKHLEAVSSAPMEVTLNIPALFPAFSELGEDDYRSIRLEALRKILSRSSREQSEKASCESWLYHQFGGCVSDGQSIPYASITALKDGLSGREHHWMRADPVYLYPDTHSLVLQDPGQLNLQPDEIDRIRDVIEPLLGDYGVVLHTPHVMRWYLEFTEDKPDLHCTSLHQALMKPVNKYLPTGEDSRRWHTLFNEIQMVLATLDINQWRQERRQLPVNSLWFWGFGSFPSLQPCQYDCCIGEGELLRSLCHATNSRFKSIDDDLNASRYQTNSLMVYEKLMYAKQLNDPLRWLEALGQSEHRIFQPILKQLKSGKMKSLQILTDDGVVYRCTTHGLRKFWKRTLSATELW